MIEYIRRYFFARAVCKKFGYKFSTSFFGNKLKNIEGYRAWVDYIEKKVFVCIKDKMFYPTLAHEVGHIIDHRIAPEQYLPFLNAYNKRGLNPLKTNEMSKYGIIILREMKASRIARSLLKKWNKYSMYNMRYLSRCFSTYTQHLNKSQIADITYAGQRYIGSDQ